VVYRREKAFAMENEVILEQPDMIVDDVKEVEEEKVLDVESEFTQPENTTRPPCTVRVRFKKKLILINVVLHKIPESKINLVPTDDFFYLDTLGFSKKFWLKFRYPQDIKVHAERCVAEMDHGVLKMSFPVFQIRDNENGKLIRKKRKAEDTNDEEKIVKKQKNLPSNREDEVNMQLKLVDEINKVENEKIKNKLEKEQQKLKVVEERRKKGDEKKEKKKKI